MYNILTKIVIYYSGMSNKNKDDIISLKFLIK